MGGGGNSTHGRQNLFGKKKKERKITDEGNFVKSEEEKPLGGRKKALIQGGGPVPRES